MVRVVNGKIWRGDAFNIDRIIELKNQGMTERKICKEFDRSQGTMNFWMHRFYNVRCINGHYTYTVKKKEHNSLRKRITEDSIQATKEMKMAKDITLMPFTYKGKLYKRGCLYCQRHRLMPNVKITKENLDDPKTFRCPLCKKTAIKTIAVPR